MLTLRRQQSLLSVALKNGITEQELRSLNPVLYLNPNIYLGQVLIVGEVNSSSAGRLRR